MDKEELKSLPKPVQTVAERILNLKADYERLVNDSECADEEYFKIEKTFIDEAHKIIKRMYVLRSDIADPVTAKLFVDIIEYAGFNRIKKFSMDLKEYEVIDFLFNQISKSLTIDCALNPKIKICQNKYLKIKK